MDKIVIKNLNIFAYHGVFEEEKKRRRRENKTLVTLSNCRHERHFQQRLIVGLCVHHHGDLFATFVIG